jgi:acetyl esterase/lipase
MDGINRRAFLGTAGIAAGIGAGIGTVLPVLGASNADAQTGEKPIAVEKNVVFGKGGAIDLKLDIHRPPAGTEKRMATVHIHGGAFTGGSKDTLGGRILPLARRGYVAIAPEYRLAGQAKWPSQVDDVKAAIRWTRANASLLGINPDRIAIVGYSAGGLLALTAAGLQDPPVAACAAFYAVTDEPTAILPEGLDAAARHATMPASNVSARFAPTVFFHGVADTTVPVESSQRFFQMLRDAKVPTELHTFAGAPHLFDQVPEFAEASALMFDLFVDRYVLNPRPFLPARRG